MSHKFIPYPCDYKNTASIRSAHRRGNIFVLVLCGLIVLLLIAGTVFALINDKQAVKNAEAVYKRIYIRPDSVGIVKAAAEPGDKALPTDETKPADETRPADEPKTDDRLDDGQKPAAEVPGDPEKAIMEGLSTIPDVVDTVYPGVVGILNYQKGKNKLSEPEPVGSGSGFIFSEDGYIITNHHVIEGADKLTVTLHNGENYDATLIGGDVMTDVAVLKIEATGLKALPIGDSSKARVGEFVLAIGDPISADELSGSVTFGIVSALSREINIEGFENEYLQTDAAVNPGNSGGPLINMRGEVIGVTSAKYTSAGVDEYGQNISSEGIGFALPINNVMEIADMLIRDGKITRPGIGVSVRTYFEASGKTPGVYIESVSEGGPADQAGVKVGDRIISLDGKSYDDQEGYVAAIRSKKAGDSMKLVVDRGGETVELTIILGDLNEIHK